MRTPDGSIAELVETVPTLPPGRGSARAKARKQALDLLFEADLRGLDARSVLADQAETAETPARALAVELVDGVVTHQPELDASIAAALPSGWTLERMPRVDRCLARIAAFELAHGDLPGEVAVEQAVRLAQAYSTQDSPAFLNGLLATLKQRHDTPAP